MLLGDVAAIALSIIGFLLSLQGLWLLCRAMFPNRVRRTAAVSQRWVACFFLGLPVTAGAIFLAIFIGKGFGAIGQIIAWFIGGMFAFYAGTGTSGFVTLVGERLASPADSGRPWCATVRGGVAIELTCLVPIIGWLGVLPASIILGAGAMTLSLFGGGESEQREQFQIHTHEPMTLPALEPAEALS